jgi:multisubunit Na+/H+ antiporter MnhB subunit
MDSTRRALSAVLLGSVVGVGIGVAASWGRTGQWDAPTVVIFALATGIPVVGFAWEWLRRDDEPVDHPEDSVEFAWLERAQSGAFLDVLIFAGCATAVSSLLDRRPPGADLVLLVAMGSAVARMVVLKRREG